MKCYAIQGVALPYVCSILAASPRGQHSVEEMTTEMNELKIWLDKNRLTLN